MSRVRIGLDAGLACSIRPTGVEHFARALLSELVHLGSTEVEWHVYLPPKGDPGCTLPSHVRAHYRPDVNTLVKNPWLVSRTWVDRLRVFYAFGHLQPAGCGGRRVLTVHDTAFDEYPDCYPAGHPERAHAEVQETCRMAHRIVVPSNATRENLIRTYRFPSERIDVILEGSRPQFRPGVPGEPPARVREAGIEPPFLLCVGRIDRRKNIERVIDAYRQLVRRGVSCGGLVIAGPDDSGSQAVEERLSSGQVPGERIVRTGYLAEEELLSLYRGAAALVYPSLAEGFGLPVLEAMACGTPTITSNVSSLPEVAGDAAILVDPTSTEELAQAMEAVLSEEGLRGRLREAGLRRAAEVTWRRSAERLLQALLRAV